MRMSHLVHPFFRVHPPADYHDRKVELENKGSKAPVAPVAQLTDVKSG
jgi:hypothetical protein